MRPRFEASRLLINPPAAYAVRLAKDAADVRAAQALRFAVFNLELKEGLDRSFETCLDEDPFDAVCDHLLVEHGETGEIVGTYRLQAGPVAGVSLGYYSAQEFDFGPYEALRPLMIELGRACVHQMHRNLAVLGLLWKGIAEYAREREARLLIGCSSITSQDPAAGASVYAELCRQHLVKPEWRTRPWPACECSLSQLADEPVHIPKLLRAYLTVGAKICGPPAMDRSFKTIDFLTLLDLDDVSPAVRARFMP